MPLADAATIRPEGAEHWPPLIDTHCHLSHQRFDADRTAVLAACRAAGLCRVISIATGLDDVLAVRSLVEADPTFLAWTVGLDPFSCHAAGEGFTAELGRLRRLLEETRGTPTAPVGLGEIGLEYHHALNPKPLQRSQFEAQLELAAEHDLPVVIHSRDAHPDLIDVLGDHPRNRGVIHSFIGTPADARAFLDLGWHLSFNGTLTYKGNEALREASRLVPADRLLAETDAPYLPPIPLRGRRCEPRFVAHTVACLAEQRGERGDDVAAWTTRNACLLFGLPLPW